MNPPTLSRLHDVKHKDRPLPRDPKAAGGSLLPQATAPDAGAETQQDQTFERWVDQAMAANPADNSLMASEKTAKTEPEGSGPQEGIAAADKPEEADTAKSAGEKAITAQMPLSLVLAPPQPFAPPTPAHKPNGTTPQEEPAAPETKPLQKTAVTALSHTSEPKPAAEPSEPKKPGPTAPAPTEKFGTLVAEAKAPHDMPATPPPASPVAALRAEPLPPALPANAPQTPSLPVIALPAAIAIKALEGTRHFDIRLDPEDLGRVDVSLQIDKDGAIRAAITAETPEALQIIAREARSLEHAFDQAGFRRDNDALSFSLSDQRPSSQGQQHPHAQRQATTPTRFFVDGEPDLPPSLSSLTTLQGADGRLDVRI